MSSTVRPNPAILAAARILADRRIAGGAGARLPEALRPGDLEAALAVQAAVTDLLGESVGAWKCGRPTADRVVLAPIHASTIHVQAGRPCAVWSRDGSVKVEPELAFVMGRDLPAREHPYSPDEVDAAVARTHLALELIDSRYVDRSSVGFAENLADGLVNQGLLIGPEVDGQRARMAGKIALRVGLAQGEDIRLDGRHPDNLPLAPLYWLAEFLRARGQGLRAGQAVITGSYAGSFPVPLDQNIRVDYEGLGTLHARFVQRFVRRLGERPGG